MATLRTVLTFTLLSLSVSPLYRTAAQEGEGSEVATVPCGTKTLAEIDRLIHEALEEYSNVTINCLSFDEHAALYKAIVSGFSNSAENRRFEFVCRSGVLIGFPINGSVSDSEYGSCLRCTEEENPCSGGCVPNPEGPRCNGDCERCYGAANNCSRCCTCEFGTEISVCDCECEPGFTGRHCDECDGVINLERYIPATEPPESVEVAEDRGLGEAPEYHDGSCDEECREHDHLPVTEESSPVHNFCFACGIEYCYECENGVCVHCVLGAVEFEHECYVGEQALIAIVAREQEAEVEAEEREKDDAGLALAVSLPIVCVGVIVFFVGMAVFAHYRYPHISHHGQKRHRREKVEALPPPAHEEVWRARPTIRLR